MPTWDVMSPIREGNIAAPACATTNTKPKLVNSSFLSIVSKMKSEVTHQVRQVVSASGKV